MNQTNTIDKDILDQVRWERDVAMAQLTANGLRFAHKDDYGWILCSDRMPEEHETIFAKSNNPLVQGMKTGSDIVLTTVRNSKGDYVISGRTYCGTWRINGVNPTDKVIAWMPMPEPCKL